MQLVSIIIPVYNGEKYVERAVRSALSQTYANVEVVVTDDGSKDRTGAIIDKLAEEDKRVKAIHTPNGGVTAARTTALHYADGEWICFLDADDTLPADAIDSYSKHFDGRPDIIVSGISQSLTKQEYITLLLKLESRPELWAKVFSATLIKGNWPYLPREIVMGEDLLQNLVLADKAENIANVPQLLYDINLQNAGSVTKTFKHTQEYEELYFEHFDRLFLKRHKGENEYAGWEWLVYWNKLCGMKNAVLRGNSFDRESHYWKDIANYFANNSDGLGLSEKLLLKTDRYQKIYRIFMNLYIPFRYLFKR